MNLLPEKEKIYLCETGELTCFICIGKEICDQYRYGESNITKEKKGEEKK